MTDTVLEIHNNMSDTVLEIHDNSTRDNYNKIVIHKKMWIPVAEDLNFHSHELAARNAYNYVEKHKPNQNPAPHQTTLAADMSVHGKPSLPPKPAVPPKPVFSRNLGLHIPDNQSRKLVNHVDIKILGDTKDAVELSDRVTESESENTERKKRSLGMKFINPIENQLISTVKVQKHVDKGKDLREEKDELMKRMQKKVNILKDDKIDILQEVAENNDALDVIIATVDECGSMADVDKLKVHIKELESVTSLITVLTVRVETAENKIEVARDVTEKGVLQNKIIKLSSQLEEAQHLKEFRTRRGEAVCRKMRSYLTAATLVQLADLLDLKVKLVSELCKLEEKIQLAEHQISALDKTVFCNKR